MRKGLWTCTALLLGCGIPGDTLLNELDENQWERLCASAAEDSEERVVECDDGVTHTWSEETADEAEAACIEDAPYFTVEDCTGTVDDWLACRAAQEQLSDEEVCDGEFFTDDCMAALSCFDWDAWASG